MRRLAVALLVVAALGLAPPAQAVPIQFTVSSIQVSDANYYNFTYTNVAPLPSFALDTAGVNTVTQNLFKVSYGSSFPWQPGDQTGTISMNLGFSSPAGFPSTTDAGKLFANYVMFATDNVSLTWGTSDPYVVSFGYNDTGKLKVDMANATFNVPGSQWIAGTFTLMNAPEVEPLPLDPIDNGGTNNSAVPEPASMILLGTGLIGLATAARRRVRK
jgi:hypothetical protein